MLTARPTCARLPLTALRACLPVTSPDAASLGLLQGMKLPQRHKDISGLLVATVGQLEKDKAKLSLDPEQDKLHLEGFALKIFVNADKVDRAGRATENTAKAFYASSIFIDVRRGPGGPAAGQ